MLLATNQLQFVAMADMVLFMRDGRITEAGSYQGLLDAGGEFAALMKEAQVCVGLWCVLCEVEGLGNAARTVTGTSNG